MGRKNSPSAKKELTEIIQRYEAAKAEKRQLYLDGDQLADIADWYATERKFNDAQEVINYGLQLHPGNTGLLIEQAFLYLDTQKLSKAKEVANSITETYDSAYSKKSLWCGARRDGWSRPLPLGAPRPMIFK